MKSLVCGCLLNLVLCLVVVERDMVLQHTLTGDILRAFENPSELFTPRLLSLSNDGDIIVCYDRSKLCLYTLNGKLIRQAIFEEETIQVRSFFRCDDDHEEKKNISF